MRNFFSVTALIVLLATASVSVGWCQQNQSNKNNPEIVGQTPSPLVVDQGQSITIGFDNLIVTDEDPSPVYPNGFSLEIGSGKNYQTNGTSVTPDDGFYGRLVVRVRVEDGKNKSDWFDFEVDVVRTLNEAPEITGQSPLSMNQGESHTVEFDNLQVSDPDNNYPSDFTLTVHPGNNYTVSGNTVTPSASFSGNLNVEVSVNDGQNQSNKFKLKVEVIKAQNKAPKITGQSSVSIDQGGSLTVEFGHLQVTDPDNNYPSDFTLTVHPGNNYTVSGNTITPSANFSGNLNVEVSVNDGQNESNKFKLKVEVAKAQNEVPKIAGQSSLSIDQGGSLTVQFGHLQVTDPDNNYPSGFTLTVHPGNNYTVSGNTITPSANFSGNLNVEVSVNDGQNESNKFKLKVEVAKAQNEAPKITGQSPLTVNHASSLAIELGHLQVTDPDNNYPSGFTLTVHPGNNYTVSGNTITPSANFSGNLNVEVSVNDGQNESNKFKLKVEVVKAQNKAPKITGQSSLSIDQGGSLTVEFGHLQVTDPDNNYPSGFTLTVHPGNNYTVSGNTITPSANFFGNLNVEVSVNDGQNESNKFKLKVEVAKAQNEAPKITGQSPLSIEQGGSLTVEFGHLQVTDPDNNYPSGFTLTVHPGNNYTVSGNTITPSANFSGNLNVEVSVNDGQNESNKYKLKVEVAKAQNQAPKITGQSTLSVNQGGTLTIDLGHLQVTDPDNNYPSGFTLTVHPGNNYTVSGNTITPSANFSGNLNVEVSVNDGQNESNKFKLKIDVIKAQNQAPKITGQSTLSVNQGGTLTIELGHLQVTDPDNNYPSGFTLTVHPGNNYTVSGNTITPSANFSGNLNVEVSVNDGQNESNKFKLKIDVIKAQNQAPIITGQSPLSVNQGGTLTIELVHLQVTDPDNNYPADFTLIIYSGANYSVNEKAVTPNPDFSGMLAVQVSVKDKQSESNRFNLQVEVKKTDTVIPNIAPRITQQLPVQVDEGQTVTITLGHLTVIDPDNNYPADFTLRLFSGAGYTLNGNAVTPSPNFSGVLTVGVSVSDGKAESNRFELKVDVRKANIVNIKPRIMGQEYLQINEDESFTLQVSHLRIDDPDNDFPHDYTLKVAPGPNYTLSGTTLTPLKDFSGTLSLAVNVHDGTNESDPFNLQVNVSAVNDGPLIVGQESLRTSENTIIAITLSQLHVIDPDNVYPKEFSLKILPGKNYSYRDNLLSPVIGYAGDLEVNVVVTDGNATSPEYKLIVTVVPLVPNVAPVITGQKPIAITQNTSLTILLSHLLVTDPDDDYPQNFTLKVFPGTNYTVNEVTITPAASVVMGTLLVEVTVSDGKNESAPFLLKISVVPLSVRPLINGQKELTMSEDGTYSVTLEDLLVSDADNAGYPNGFSLNVFPISGSLYRVDATTITPAKNYYGFIEVGVTVNDGKNTSEDFHLAILITPVNDPPEIVEFHNDPLVFEPGREPIALFESADLRDVDDEYLIMMDVGFDSASHQPGNDEILFDDINPNIRVVHDAKDVLHLIGFAPIEDYRKALQAIKYNYRMTTDANGNPTEILSGPRIAYVRIYDGALASSTYHRFVNMEIQITLDIPNAFTPDGDQTNDTWRLQITNTDQVDNAVIRIYDKRGNLVHESTGFESTWDGIYKGQVLPVDTYYYTIDLKLPYAKKVYKGTVTLLH